MEIIINGWAVTGATVAAMFLGMWWYGPLFGSMWMRLVGLTPETQKAMKLTSAKAVGLGFIVTYLIAYVLAHGIVFGNAYLGTSGVVGGMMGALWYWLGFAVPLTAGAYLWEGKSIKLWVLNAAYYLVSFLLMGAILGYFA